MHARFASVAGLAILLSACQLTAPQPAVAPAVPAPQDLRAPYARLARDGARVYALDAAASTVRIYVFRGGKVAKVGHNHILGVSQFEGYAAMPGDSAAQARFDLRVPLASLVIDDPAWRALTGENFGGERSASDIEGTRRNMLGPKVLDAGHFPNLDIRSVSIQGDWPELVAETAITLKGQTRTQWLPLQVQRQADSLRATGTFVLRQTDFGIEPFSVLGGLMAVQDEVVVRFELVGRTLALESRE
jgi:polyisoprenoid-binding protein YceI